MMVWKTLSTYNRDQTFFDDLFRRILALFLLAGLVSVGGGMPLAVYANEEAPRETGAEPSLKRPTLVADRRAAPDRAAPDQGVCVFQGALVRKSPGGNGEPLTRLNVGETFRFLNETQEADLRGKTREYSKVELIGGDKGWVRSDMIAIDAQPAAVLRTAVLHERPTVMASTEASFRAMDVVAVLKEEDAWVKVRGMRRGEQWWDEGWVKPDALTKKETDVTVAALWKKAQAEDDASERRTEIERVTENSSLEDSPFIDTLTARLQEMKTATYVQDGEEQIFGFETEGGKQLSLVRETENSYLAYRFGTDDEIELAYPESKDDGWSKFRYYAPQDSETGAKYLYFTRDEYEYVVFTEGRAQGDHLRKSVVQKGKWKILTEDLEEKQLRGLTKRELRLVRNTIFARHGYTFDTDWIAEHFSQFDWYEPKGKSVELTDVEKKNVKLVQRVENNRDRHGPTSCGVKVKPPGSDEVTTINCKPETVTGSLGNLQRFDQLKKEEGSPPGQW